MGDPKRSALRMSTAGQKRRCERTERKPCADTQYFATSTIKRHDILLLVIVCQLQQSLCQYPGSGGKVFALSTFRFIMADSKCARNEHHARRAHARELSRVVAGARRQFEVAIAEPQRRAPDCLNRFTFESRTQGALNLGAFEVATA